MEKEKKEIGKLLELLNEYEKESNLKSEIFGEKSEFIVISKKFGFIKRLVENDKIDLGLYREYMPNLGEDFSVESNIIMNLSIAIDPIGYLNYILK